NCDMVDRLLTRGKSSFPAPLFCRHRPLHKGRRFRIYSGPKLCDPFPCAVRKFPDGGAYNRGQTTPAAKGRPRSMREKEVLLPPEGLAKLEKELELLKTVRRREIAERIRQALEFGDISENSEYDDAKNEQAFLEGKILQLEK